VILGDLSKGSASGKGPSATLDDLFRRTVLRRPNDIALVDPPNRASFTHGAPYRLTYAEADRAVSALARRLRRMGLATDTVLGIQLPNTVESVLMLLAALRAGMIAAPLPLLWRRLEVIAALSRIGAKGLITCGHVGTTNHCELAMHIAAESFPIRYVCAFGPDLPDGVVSLDELQADDAGEPMPKLERPRNPAAHVAVVTFDVTADGLVPVARNHTQLIFGGVSILLESQLAQEAVILSAMINSSFAGLCATVLPWLLVGGTLVLHEPLDVDVLRAQCRNERCGAIVLPGPSAARLADGGPLDELDRLQTIIGVWRSPERLPLSPPSRGGGAAMVDVHVFGEVGLFAARRGTNGRPATVGFGPIRAPRTTPGAALIGELALTETGTVAFRGPMVEVAVFPPGPERAGLAKLKVLESNFVDTGYTCRVDPETRAMIVTGPPPGVVNVGFYRFAWHDLQAAVANADRTGSVVAVPDPLTGYRLIGSAADLDDARQAMIDAGLNPLVVEAFRGRNKRGASAA
jgi:hypothetical protein